MFILQAVVALVLAHHGWNLDVSERFRPSGENTYSQYNDVAATVKSRLGSEDLYLDCSNHFVNIALLPRQTHKGMPILNADNEGQRCLAWIFSSDTPSTGGSVWFSTATDKKIRIRQGNNPDDRQSLSPIVKESGLWELIWEDEPFQLWRRN
jgi:hypothetical protein